LSRFFSWRLTAAAALLWAGVLPLAAWLRGVPGGFAALVSFLVYGVGSVICHQRPERSFHLGVFPLPVCARCVGIYAGGAAIAVAALVGCRFRAYSATRARAWLTAAAAPAVLSLVYEWVTAQIPANSIRAVTGVLLGGAVATILLALRPHEARPDAESTTER
jgi:uncharacterized membrane protein